MHDKMFRRVKGVTAVGAVGGPCGARLALVTANSKIGQPPADRVIFVPVGLVLASHNQKIFGTSSEAGLVRDLTEAEQRLAYRFAHVPLPLDAADCDPWCWHGDYDWRRYFLTREWDVSGVWVTVAGEQNHRGEITRWMHVGGEDQCMTSDRWRLIAALVDAGRLLDTLNAGDEPSITAAVDRRRTESGRTDS